MKRAGKREAGGRAGDGHRAVLERLAQNLEHVLLELRQLVEEEHAVVGERHLARPGHVAAADQAGVGDGVVGRAERPGDEQRCLLRQQPGDGIDLGGLEGLVQGQIAGRMVGSRRASMVLPVPGAPTSRILCPPAAAISMARLACSWPRTSLKSTG